MMINLSLVLGSVLAFLAALAMPLLDRMRGSDTGVINRTVCKYLMSFAVLLMLFGANVVNYWIYFWFIALYLVGSSIGWGAPVGAGLQQMTEEQYRKLVEVDKQKGLLEWYVRGKLKGSWLSGLFMRGLLWGFLPAIPLAVYGWHAQALMLLFTYTLAMPFGVVAANIVEGTKVDEALKAVSLSVTEEADKWGNQEILRGLFVGISLLTFYICSTIS